MYLANWTRPDIAFAVGRLSRRMVGPTAGDLTAAKAVLRYFKGTKAMGLRFCGDADLTGWVDADWAGDVTSRKSTTGFLFTLHGGSIAWRSRLQTLVTDTTADAEFVAASEAAKDSLWLRRVVGSLGENDEPVLLREDNQACLAMANKAAMSSRTKHLHVRTHLVRDYVKRGEVRLEHVPTEEQLADGFTKPLDGDKFRRFRDALSVRWVRNDEPGESGCTESAREC